jgi:hypothetical protein
MAATAQTGLDVSQTFPESDLCERHAEELIPCRKTSGSSFHRVAAEATVKLLGMNQFQDLRENNFAKIHLANDALGLEQAMQSSNRSHPNNHANLWKSTTCKILSRP